MIRKGGRPLLHKRDAPRPTATMAMLESMLDEEKEKKRKPKKQRRDTAKTFLEDVSNSQPEMGRIIPTGGLEDAPSFVSKKVLPLEGRIQKRKQVNDKDAMPVKNTKREEKGTKGAVSSEKATSIPLALNIGRNKKRPRDHLSVSSLSASIVGATAKPKVLHPASDGAPATDQVLIDLSQQGFASFTADSLQQRFEEQSTTGEAILPSRTSHIAQYIAREPQIRLDEAQSNVERSRVETTKAPVKHKVDNENFVRLNLRNTAGACRGARNKKIRMRFHKKTDDILVDNGVSKAKRPAWKKTADQSGVDPLDDFLDGVYRTTNDSSSKVPKCPRHQRPCKLLSVKKNTTGNKGRKFYVCSFPRGEQCEHFEWADNTVEVGYTAS